MQQTNNLAERVHPMDNTTHSASAPNHGVAVPVNVLSEGYWYVLDVIVNDETANSGTVVLAMDYRENTVELTADWAMNNADIEAVSATLGADALDQTGVAISEDDPAMQELLETILTKGAPQWKREVHKRVDTSGDAAKESADAEPLRAKNDSSDAENGAGSIAHLVAGNSAKAPEPETGESAAPVATEAPETSRPAMGEDRVVLRQPRGRDVAFAGEKIGCVSLAATVGESIKLLVKETNLYRTEAGNFVIEEIHGSAPELGSTTEVPGMDRRQITVCTTQDEVIERLGNDWMAKELYWQSGIEDVEIIE